MTNYQRHFLTIFFCLLFSEHFVIAQEISSEEWDAKYTSWDSQLESGIQAVEEKKYSEARAHLLKAYELAQELFEEDDEDLGETAVRYGEVNRKLGLFKEAEKAYRTALNYVRLDLGEEDVSFGFIMNQLGLTYDDLEDYDAAFSCFNQAISSAKVHFGEEHIQYLARMQNLALVYLSLDDNDKALPIFEEVVEKAEDLLDENSNTLGAFYNNLGLAYLNFNNRLDEAEIVLTKAVNISEINNEYGFSYVMRLFNLANVYYTQGLMQEAFNFLQKALFTAEENIPNHPINLKLYNNLSTLYFAFDNIEKAGDYYNLSIKFIEENGLENTLDHASTLVNNAKYYLEWGFFDDAIKKFEKALKIIEEKLGVNSDRYLSVLASLSISYNYSGNSEYAVELSERALKIASYLKGETSSEYADHLNNLALAISKTGDMDRSITLLEQSLEIKESLFGSQSQKYTIAINNLTFQYLEKRNIPKVLELMKKINGNYLHRIQEIFSFQGEVEKKALISNLLNLYSINQSVLFDFDSDDDFKSMNLSNVLLLKNLILNSSKDILKDLKSINNAEVNKKVETLISLKGTINHQLMIKKENRDVALNEWIQQRDRSENELIQIHSEYFSSTILFPNWREIKNNLKDQEVAIEFSKFNYYHNDRYTDSVAYIAYIIKKDSEQPTYVKLFFEDELSQIIIGSSPSSLYATRGSKSKLTNVPKVNSKDLYNLIWKPLEKELIGVERVFYSPDGLLHQIAFSSIEDSSEELLSSKYELHRLSSTTMLTRLNEKLQPNSIALIGGVNYNYKHSEKLVNHSEELLEVQGEKSRSNRGLGNNWDYLEGTLNEIENIAALIENESIFTGDKATEENIKRLSGESPSILHIATHGFFYDKIKAQDRWKMERAPEEVVYKYAKDPLLRSGLILAGANYAWQYGSNPFEDEDGVLTALEISNLDLSNTDMVVLSACETGLGDIDGSEGVYGLQRAFKMAGVDLIMMSLWEVPDKETAEFMNHFYSSWLGGMDVRNAFIETQRTMSKTYKDAPEKWAAFVLVQ